MNVLCDLPIWKSVANAFYTCTEQFTPPTEPLSRDRAHERDTMRCLREKRAMKYMFNIYFYYINGFSYR